MAVLIEIVIRSVKDKTNGNISQYIQIKEQLSGSIDYTNSKGTFRLLSCLSPEIQSDTFYLRGSNSNEDLNWLLVKDRNHLDLILNTLIEYGNIFCANLYLNTKDKELSLILNDVNMESGYNGSVLCTDSSIIFGNLKYLTYSTLDDMKIKQNKINCNKCGVLIEHHEIKIYEHNGLYKNVCAKCYSTFKSCNHCSIKLDDEDLNTFTNSIGENKDLCKRCSKTSECIKCSFDELNISCNNITIIQENGLTKHPRICKKCSQDGNFTVCKINCGYSYDKNIYPTCPCLVGDDFSPYTLRHDADVTKILPSDKEPVIGLEIEVGVKATERFKFDEVYKHTKNIIKDDAITVFDRSINEIDTVRHIMNNYRGFEIVTRPLNKYNSEKFVKELTEKRHRLLKSWDVGTAGIHIHIAKRRRSDGKPFLTSIQIGKLLVFMNDPNNSKLIKHVGRRYSEKYAKFNPNKKITDYKDTHPDCHYEALNTNKPHTIEFRIFRGSLKKETVMSYLQFVWSLIDFVKETATKDLKEEIYLNYLLRTPKSCYRDLKNRLKTLNKRGQMEVGGED